MNHKVEVLFAGLAPEKRENYLLDRDVTAEIRAEVEALLRFDSATGGTSLTDCVAASAERSLEADVGFEACARYGSYSVFSAVEAWDRYAWRSAPTGPESRFSKKGAVTMTYYSCFLIKGKPSNPLSLLVSSTRSRNSSIPRLLICHRRISWYTISLRGSGRSWNRASRSI